MKNLLDGFPDFTESQLTTEQLFKGRLLDVRRDSVSLPNGSEAVREYIVHSGAAAIIPLMDDGSVLLEYQYRYPNQRHYIEIPAGKLEPHEPTLVAAQRELLEETGYRATHWQHLTTLHLCIAYSTEKIEFFLARGLHFEGHQRDEEEFLETLALPLEEAFQWVADGRINDAKTVAGLLWLKAFGQHLIK
ncbi:MAG: NUDIX hydrolase [Betaproteobacteria bacterium]|nr:NUDIX hydrolase [Betaproteobacteria bacterium]